MGPILIGMGEASAADRLAGLCAALGAPWPGPVAVPAALPAGGVDGPWLLEGERERLLAPDERRRLGAHHTPRAVARRLAAIALDGLGPDAVVGDPACGGGAFLLAAAEALADAGGDPARIVREQLRGADLDPLAVATTRAALALWAGLDEPAPLVEQADGLALGWRGLDAVVGNPPFRSPLAAGATADGGPAPYTDLAARFLAASLDLVREGGRVVLVQPESVLAARDAAAVRTLVVTRGSLEGLWVAGERVFAAGVRVCAPVVRVGSGGPGRVRRWRGAAVRRTASAPMPSGPTWAPLRPVDAPRPSGIGRRRVGDLARASAGFRDEFYGLAAAAAEADGPDDARPRLVTSGLVDPGRMAWGERPAKLHGRRFERPVLGEVEGPLAGWVAARLVPKVLVATQTRVLEAAPDPTGRHVPVTPVVAVVPHDPADVWCVAAALLNPSATAWALRNYGGTALSGDAVKLSAKQVLDVPLPADEAALADAADLVRAGDVAGAAHRLAATPALGRWWSLRAGRAAG